MSTMIAWPDKPKCTEWPPISFAVRYGLAPVSVGLALALARIFLYFNWPQPFTALALSAIAITFWYGSTKSGFIATLIASLVRNYLFQPEISVTARVVYDLVFLLFALLMMRVTQDQNKLEVKVVEQNAELAQANEVLKRAELNSRMLIDAIPQQIWSAPPDGTLDYCNQRWRSETGLGLQELHGDLWQSILHPDDRDRVLNAWRQSVITGITYEQEERHRQPDGTFRWFLSRALPLFDEQGRIVRWYGTNTDIEDRKRVEDELRHLSAQLLQSQDEERRRIAADLHDSTGQDLVALATLSVNCMSRFLPARKNHANCFLTCKTLLAACMREVRSLSYLLYPPLLDQAGLEDAIRDYVHGFTKRSGIRVALELSAGVGRMARDVELTLFRVVQEALTNVQRHSGSDQAEIRIQHHSDLLLEIIDHGDNTSNRAHKAEEQSPYKIGVSTKSHLGTKTDVAGNNLPATSRAARCRPHIVSQFSVRMTT
jgi:PAS domain S-box-containing protein